MGSENGHTASVKIRYNNYSNNSILLYSWDNGASPDELTYRKEELHMTSRQIFFVTIHIGNKLNRIVTRVPVSLKEAENWIKLHVPNAETIDFDEMFGLQLQRARGNYCASKMVFSKITKIAEDENLPISAVVEKLLLKGIGYYGERGLFDVPKETLEEMQVISEDRLRLLSEYANNQRQNKNKMKEE